MLTKIENTLDSKHAAKDNSAIKWVEQAAKKSMKSMLHKLINFITFVHLPIRKKFVLFSFGVLFWFITMFALSIIANIDINRKTNTIVNYNVPHDRITHIISRKLQSLNIDASEIINITQDMVLRQRHEMSRARISDIRDLISALMLGGEAHDFNRSSNTLIDSFSVLPLTGKQGDEGYSNNLLPILNNIETKMAEIVEARISILHNGPQGREELSDALAEIKGLLSSSYALSSKFSSRIAASYLASSDGIRKTTTVTLYSFVGVLFMAVTLLVVFTVSISESFSKPINAIIDQIRSLCRGEVDLSKKIKIRSKDEIGIMSQDFNILMDEIHEMATFKKVIEEDDSLEDVYSRLGNAFSDKFGLDEFTIFEVANNQNKMKPIYPIILNEKEICCNEDILANSDLCKVKRTGHNISSIDYPHICKQFKAGLDKVHVCMPMIVGGHIGGVVQFLLDGNDYDIDRKDIRMFKAEQYIKESLSVIEAKRLTNTLRESALKDALTGLYNRRFLQEYTETLVAGLLRREKNVGLIMCDIDFFKQVNDLYGHNAGDAILKETSHLIVKCVRSSDLVIRFGGEEFLVLMLDIKEGETIKLAEKIRKTFEDTKIKVADGTIKKTISLGVSEFPIDAESFWQSIKYADVALYKAKETGRNKAVRFTEDMWTANEF
jgi:diguanylate cyclase (GGDEF)-like protein